MTKHSNLGDVQVVFHLVVDPRRSKSTPLINLNRIISPTYLDLMIRSIPSLPSIPCSDIGFIGASLNSDARLLAGLRNILTICSQFDIEYIALPIMLLETPEESMILTAGNVFYPSIHLSIQPSHVLLLFEIFSFLTIHSSFFITSSCYKYRN